MKPIAISPTGLDSTAQCVARRLYEERGAPAFNRFAAAAVARGGLIHDAVRQLAQHATEGVAGDGAVVKTDDGAQPVSAVARGINDAVRERWPDAPLWAIERPFAYFADAEHRVMVRGRNDYAPFGHDLECLGVCDLKTRGNVSPRYQDQLASITMHRQLFACAIACMVPAYVRGIAGAAAVADDGSGARPHGTWGRGWAEPMSYAEVADAIETSPLPEVWLLVWDLARSRPIWRAHWISRKALRAFLTTATRDALAVGAAAELPAEAWPRSFNCDDPWECPHKMRCTHDLGDPPPDDLAATQAAVDSALFALGSRARS